MRNNFYPSKPQLAMEVEKCITGGNMETLMSFCNSCIFAIFRTGNESACGTCVINQGIARAKEKRATDVRKNEEILSDIIDALKSDAHC